MQIGYLGLGKMGKNMVWRLLEKGHQVVAWNRSAEPRLEVVTAGAQTAETINELVLKLAAPRTLWLMLPAGEATQQTVQQLSELLTSGDTVIDGSNSHYIDTIQNGQLLSAKKINFLDVGVSGGPAGARHGACLMIGGDQEIYQQLVPLFTDLAAPDAFRFFPGTGAGHFVKMIHNGIEYGMMQAIGEGFAVLKASPFNCDLNKVAQIYSNQSVIASRLVDWLKSGYEKHSPALENISGSVAQSGEGKWTVEAAEQLHVSTPVIAASVQFRADSTQQPSYTGQVVSVLRNEFGGHQVDEKK